jgi:hypothetical protein
MGGLRIAFVLLCFPERSSGRDGFRQLGKNRFAPRSCFARWKFQGQRAANKINFLYMDTRS